MATQIRLFGTTTVVADDEITVTAPRQRAVLARLALMPGIAVSADQLLTDIWGDELPGNGAKAVAFQITKLRDLIEPDRVGPGTAISTEPAGYRLNIERTAVDVHEFERLVSDARASLDDPRKARSLVDDALAIWRGAPFAGIDEQPWVSDGIARLNQLRLLAERSRVQARMAEGDHAEIIAELEQLIRNHPLEEGLVADYMTALAETGRPADALRAYGELRIRLSDELGIEPSNDLVALERRLLEGRGSVTADHGRASDPRGNLPSIPTSFVGRDEAMGQIDEALGRSPIVVLTGPGGSGKTRLAIEHARRRQHNFCDGAFLVELAPLSPDDDTMAALGETLGLRPGEGAGIAEVVSQYLRHRELLLIVDNCEHVRGSAAAAITEVGRVAAGVSIIATSRESLGVPGENLVAVPPLEVAGENDAGAGLSPAVELFCDRARQAGITVEDLSTAARICERLEGMPLAIELAAARLRTVSPDELDRRIEASLHALSAPDKSRVGRHRTLRATVEWSYSLLSAEEQFALQRLSVFAGSFDIKAAEAVARRDDLTEWDVFDLLDSLVDKSLVSASRTDGPTMRYSILIPVREFAAAKLIEDQDASAIRLEHGRHYAALAADAAPHTRSEGYSDWADRLRAELHNIRLAGTTLVAQGHGRLAANLGFDLQIFFINNGMHIELIDLLLGAVDVLPTSDHLPRIKALWVAAIAGAEITDPRSVTHARRGLAAARATGDPNLIGRMELALGAAIGHTSPDPEYLEHLVEGRRLLEANPEPLWWEPTWERGFLNFIIGAYLPQTDDRIVEHFEVGIAAFQEAEDHVLRAAILGQSASLWGLAEDDWVLTNARESVAILTDLQTPYWCGHSHIALGFLLLDRDDPQGALEQFDVAGGQLMDLGDINCWAVATGRAADCEALVGDLDAAHRNISAVIDAIDILPLRELHEARALDTLAFILTMTGSSEEAAAVLGLASEYRFPFSIWPRQPRHQALINDLASLLGSDRLQTLLAEGADSSFDQAVGRYRSVFS